MPSRLRLRNDATRVVLTRSYSYRARWFAYHFVPNAKRCCKAGLTIEWHYVHFWLLTAKSNRRPKYFCPNRYGVDALLTSAAAGQITPPSRRDDSQLTLRSTSTNRIPLAMSDSVQSPELALAMLADRLTTSLTARHARAEKQRTNHETPWSCPLGKLRMR